MTATLLVAASVSIASALAGNYHHPHPGPPPAPPGCYYKVLVDFGHGEFARGTLICWHPFIPPSTGGGTPPPPPPVVCTAPWVMTPTGCQLPVVPPTTTKPHVNNQLYCVQTSNRGWSSLNLYLGGLNAGEPWRVLFESKAAVNIPGEGLLVFTGIEGGPGQGLIVAPLVPGKGASCDVDDINNAIAAGTIVPADPTMAQISYAIPVTVGK